MGWGDRVTTAAENTEKEETVAKEPSADGLPVDCACTAKNSRSLDRGLRVVCLTEDSLKSETASVNYLLRWER